jgi:hypothetical protein
MLSTEFAWFFLALQVLISLVFIALGALAQTLGMVALGLMAISWLGLLRMHRQAHAADEILRSALQQGLGREFRDEIPTGRQPVLRDHIVAREWLRPFSMMRPGVERLDDIAYGDPTYQPGFEQADTHVDAVIPLYGVYDFTDHDGQDLNRALRDFLGDKVMPGSKEEFGELWTQASPIARVSAWLRWHALGAFQLPG